MIDLAPVGNLGWDATCYNSHHLACATPFLFHRYANISLVPDSVVSDIDINTALVIPFNIVAVSMPFDKLDISIRRAIVMSAASYVVLSGCTVLVTMLVAVRLLLVRRQHTKIMGRSPKIFNVQLG